MALEVDLTDIDRVDERYQERIKRSKVSVDSLLADMVVN
jgi:hypothetical protein